MLYEPKKNPYVVFGYADLFHLTTVEGFCDNASDAFALAKKASNEKPGYFLVGDFNNAFDEDDFHVFCFVVEAACLDGKTVAPYPAFGDKLEFIPDTKWGTEGRAGHFFVAEIPVSLFNKLLG